MGISGLIQRLAIAVAAVVVVSGCSGDGEAAKGESPAARDLASTAGVLEGALASFRREAHDYPRVVRLRGQRVQASGGGHSAATIDDRVGRKVRLEWYVGFPDARALTDAEAAAGQGFAYCLSEAGLHRYVASDDKGSRIDGPRKGDCPGKAQPAVSSAQLDAARASIESAMFSWFTSGAHRGRYPQKLTIARGGGLVLTPRGGAPVEVSTHGVRESVRPGVRLGWYDDLALRKQPIASGAPSRAELIPQPNPRHGKGYSVCIDNGEEWRILVIDHEGTLDAEGDGACPVRGY